MRQKTYQKTFKFVKSHKGEINFRAPLNKFNVGFEMQKKNEVLYFFDTKLTSEISNKT